MDANLGRDVDSTRSTTRYIYIVRDIVTLWLLQLHKVILLSTIEVEYIAISDPSKEII